MNKLSDMKLAISIHNNYMKMLYSEVDPYDYTWEQIIDCISAVYSGLPKVAVINEEDLLLELRLKYEAQFDNATVGVSGDDVDHVPWLHLKRPQIEWNFWLRYRNYLIQDAGRSLNGLKSLETSVDLALGSLEDPERLGPWQKRGLMVGRIQSGKTEHYYALINKAVDTGYKIIIVLSGLSESLRCQTQLRADLGFYGWETDQDYMGSEGSRVGVGKSDHNEDIEIDPAACYVQPLTLRKERSDFSRQIKYQNPESFYPHPVVVVTKKNVTVLKNLISWLESKSSGWLESPALIIDDEADSASINIVRVPKTEDGKPKKDADPSAINSSIRQLAGKLQRCAVVGYTATPYANLYVPFTDETSITPESTDLAKVVGNDLFPKDFIRLVPNDDSYIGLQLLFGSAEDDPEIKGPISGSRKFGTVRPISTKDSGLLAHRNKDFDIAELPESLREAIRAFIMSCAVRNLRGQSGEHKTMLVHSTRYRNVQRKLRQLIREYVYDVERKLKYGEGDNVVLQYEMMDLWDKDFIPTSLWVAEGAYINDQGYKERFTSEYKEHNFDIEWEDVWKELPKVAGELTGGVRLIQGHSEDSLVYANEDNPVTIIAVGGDMLNRGLTLEGLSVSYFTRTTKAYDTLTQMGRWFGYRKGYADLCRLYADQGLLHKFENVSRRDEEVREMLADLGDRDATPKQVPLSIRTIPDDDCLLTSKSKMGAAILGSESYSSKIVQTLDFTNEAKWVEANFSRISAFLSKCGNYTKDDHGHIIFTSVPGNNIADLIYTSDSERLYVPMHAHNRSKATPDFIAQYIRDRIANGDLQDWTLALINNSQGHNRFVVSGHEIGLPTRSFTKHEMTKDDSQFFMNNLRSPEHELLDITLEEKEIAKKKKLQALVIDYNTKKNIGHTGLGEYPTIDDVKDAHLPPIVRQHVRSAGKGLIVLYPIDPMANNNPMGMSSSTPIMGWAISFPRYGKTAPRMNMINAGYQQHFDDNDFVDEEMALAN